MSAAMPAHFLPAARAWLADCMWSDLDGDDIAALSDDTVRRGIARHYIGGWAAFIADGD